MTVISTRTSRVALAIAVLVVFAGCTPAQNPGPRESGQGPSQAPKVLTWIASPEPTELLQVANIGGSSAGVTTVRTLAHERLIIQDHAGGYHAELATVPPSIGEGTWRIFPDGRMQTVWKLHPNIKWHDGTPFTSSDLLFSLTVWRDPGFPATRVPGVEKMESASSPDPETFVINWSQTYYAADVSPYAGPMPRHLLEPLYLQNDSEAYTRSPYFGPEFVGLGPYRLARWELGSHMEFTRFDDYFRGRPNFDRVIVRFIADPNARMAAALAESVDVMGLEIDQAIAMGQRLEAGHRVITTPTTWPYNIMIQYRPETARPKMGLTDRTVRQALYHAIDREAYSEAAVGGLAPVADSWFSPIHELRKEVESAIPQYPYNPLRAKQLLTQTGWGVGPDGMLVHGGTGERFELELTGLGPADERKMEIIAHFWKAVGVDGKSVSLPTALRQDREVLSSFPGTTAYAAEYIQFFTEQRLHSRQIAAPANRWSGRNAGGYDNPSATALMDRLTLTIDKDSRIALHRQLLQEMLGDVAMMPLVWDIRSIYVSNSVKGDVHAFESGWNIDTWDM